MDHRETQAIHAAARSFNPFTIGATRCTLTCDAALGPCHTPSP